MNYDKKLDVTTYVKLALVIDPEFSKLMEGNYEKLMACKTPLEQVFVINSAMNQYFTNENISFEERYQVYKHVSEFKSTKQVHSVFEQLEPSAQQFFCSIFGDLRKIQEIIKEAGIDTLDDNYLKKEFAAYLRMQSSDARKHIEIEKLLDPFYLDQHQLLVNKRNFLLQKIKEAPSAKLVSILNTIENSKITSIDENDFVIDFDSLNNVDCERIMAILTNND